MNRKVTGTASSIPAGLALGTCAALAVTIGGSVLAANLVLKEVIMESNIGYCSMTILLLSSFLSAWIASARIKHRRLYVCLMSAIIYYAMLLAITALFFGGQYQAMGVTALMVIAGAGAAVILGMRGEKKFAARRNKNRRR